MKTLIAILLIVGLDLSAWWLLAVGLVLVGEWVRRLAREQRQAAAAGLKPNHGSESS